VTEGERDGDEEDRAERGFGRSAAHLTCGNDRHRRQRCESNKRKHAAGDNRIADDRARRRDQKKRQLGVPSFIRIE
jgi:hypothetical protein